MASIFTDRVSVTLPTVVVVLFLLIIVISIYGYIVYVIGSKVFQLIDHWIRESYDRKVDLLMLEQGKDDG